MALEFAASRHLTSRASVRDSARARCMSRDESPTFARATATTTARAGTTTGEDSRDVSLGVRVNPLARAFAGRLETELRARLVTATATCDRAFEEARAELERFRPGAVGTHGET